MGCATRKLPRMPFYISSLMFQGCYSRTTAYLLQHPVASTQPFANVLGGGHCACV